MEEIWKPITGFDGMYEVSSIGRVRSFKKNIGASRNDPKILKPYIENNGYLRLSISHNNKKTHLSIHRVVAEVFLPNPENKPQVNHKDGDKTNNHISNLEWCTASENHIHAFKKGLRTSEHKQGENNHFSILTETEVLEIKHLATNEDFTQSEIAERYGIDPSVVSRIKNGKSWSHITA